jgi:hypothetical protein
MFKQSFEPHAAATFLYPYAAEDTTGQVALYAAAS